MFTIELSFRAAGSFNTFIGGVCISASGLEFSGTASHIWATVSVGRRLTNVIHIWATLISSKVSSAATFSICISRDDSSYNAAENFCYIGLELRNVGRSIILFITAILSYTAEKRECRRLRFSLIIVRVSSSTRRLSSWNTFSITSHFVCSTTILVTVKSVISKSKISSVLDSIS